MGQRDPRASERTARRLALAGVLASSVLSVLHIGVGRLSRSSSVLAAGVEFAADVFASSVVLLGMAWAVRPADDDHPYGHGRFETLAALAVGLVLAGGGTVVCWTSLQSVGAVHPPPGIEAPAVLLFAIAVRSVLFALKFRTGRRLRSGALVADAWNDAVDVLAALVALTAVALTRYDESRFLAADHYGGFAVGVIVVLIGVRVLRDASLDLADTMPDRETLDRIRAVAASVPGVADVEKCFARKTGFRYLVDLHIEVDPSLSVEASHEIAGRVRSRLRAELDWVADVLVHVEPVSADPEATSRRDVAG